MTPQSRRPSLNELSASRLDTEDDRILDLIAALYTTLDPVPDGLVDRIQFGITLDALHAEIAELQRSGDPVGVRSGETSAQTVTFTSQTITTMVTVTPTLADRARIDGWVVPGAGIDVELRLPGQSLHVVADDNGRFVFEDVPRGLVQFVLRPPSNAQNAVITPSIEI